MFESPSSEDVSTGATSALDEAQKEPSTERQEYFAKLKEFFSNTISSGLKLLIWCIFSLLVIYFCKVAQSNILPTDVNCFPYTGEKGHEPEHIELHIFTNLFFIKPRKAMILEFPDTHNSLLDGILKSLKEYKDNAKSSALGNYFVAILESLFLKNLNYYNFMFSFLNQLPEFLLVLFGPYLAFFILIVGIIINIIFFCYYWISNLSWLWKKNVNIIVNKDGIVKYKNGPPEWENVHWNELQDPNDSTKTVEGSSEWTAYLMAVIVMFIFIGILFTLLITQGLLIFGAVFSIFCLISLLMYKITLAGKKSSITELFVYFFKYNKLIIMSMFSFYVITNAYTYLGYTPAIFAVITLFCIYYFKVIEMFVPVKSDLDERVEVEINSTQAYKVPCDPPPENDIISDDDTGDKKATFRDRMRMTTTNKNEISAMPPKPGTIVTPSPAKPGTPPAKPGTIVTPPPAKPGTSPVAPGTIVTSPPAKPGTIVTSPPAKPGTSPVAPGTIVTSPPAKPGTIVTSPPAKPGTPPVAPPGTPPGTPPGPKQETLNPQQKQSGGKKFKLIEIDSNNIVRELKKFNKKYAQFLL